MRRGFYLPSGRVISLGRLLLASLFMIAVWLDVGGFSFEPQVSYAIFAGYVAFAAAIVVLTWSSWWLDSQLAGPAHAIDIVFFTILVAATEGYASPFFSFFMFLLLSAAIRWGWRATALTAVLLTLLFILPNALLTKGGGPIDFQPLLVRTGNLIILSLILIWFGINQWRAGAAARREGLLAAASPQDPPLETGLAAAMEALGARSGLFVWQEQGRPTVLVEMRNGEALRSERPLDFAEPQTTLLYDLGHDRALSRDSGRNLCRASASDLLLPEAAELGLRKGVAMPVRTGSGRGMLFLERVRSLSTDHIDIGDQVSADVAAHMQRHALFRAAEESAEARSRLGLARDLHDSVVQFLAGAAFRLEAMKRTTGTGRDLEPELNELKQLMLHEQEELREFISALRSSSRIDSEELAQELDQLASRLSRQWGIRCIFSAETEPSMVPARLHLDAKQLLREAVANAVRHAGATSVTIKLQADPQALKLHFINNGARYPTSPEDGELPRTIRERVEQAGGELDLSRGMEVTRISVSLPLAGNAR